MSKSVLSYIEKQKLWKNELMKLRSVLLSTGMDETIKWGRPVYVFQNNNIVGMSAFKTYFGLWFFQGVFLTDSHNKLVNAQKGKTKALRQWRFTDMSEIDESTLLEYVVEAIENSKRGKKIMPERKKLLIPLELSIALESDKKLQSAFNNFNISKRIEFSEYIDSAKRESTRKSRVNKSIPLILNGIGLYDRYK